MHNRLTEEQLEALVKEYQRPLLAFATRLLQDPQDAEEVANDVFLTAGMRADLSRGTAAPRRGR
jgi:DNA-directed RNA polymerase specialized sigma24 family protein